jgi:hypothetical protein
VNRDDLTLTIDYPRDQKPNIDGRVQDFINTVSQWLGWAQNQIDGFNANLEAEARRAIEARRKRVEERDAHLAQSTIPIRRPGQARAKTHIPDVLVRRPAPSLPRTRADDQRPALEPVLEEKVFEHILGVIRAQGKQMEQNPGAFREMGEEDRRQVILGTLNTHYEGFATAETHNYKGHTDILVRYESKNLFVCECKFWGGQESFKDTIDQLFGYVAWRDTKLAIIMFVREKGLTAILKKAREALGAHPQFVAWKEAADEAELRVTMRWPGDEERHADLNVFLIHTPETRN